MEHGAWERESIRCAEFSQLGQFGTAGIRQTQKLGRFIKRLACRIVYALTQQGVIADTAYSHKLRMSARHQQSDKWKFRLIVCQQRREQMAFKMVDGNNRLADGKRQSVGEA